MAVVRMQASLVAGLIALQLQATSAHTDASGPSLRGSESARLLTSFPPLKQDAAFAFWNAYEGKSSYNGPERSKIEARITDNWSLMMKEVANAGITDGKEFAMFVANVMQESGQLSVKKEDSKHFDDDKYNWGDCPNIQKGKDKELCEANDDDTVPLLTECCKGKGCKSDCNVHYSGRGYLQTTNYKNYKEAKDAGCTKDSNDKDVDIVLKPGRVAEDEKLAWCTAGHYWKVNVHQDRCLDGCDMGNTIDAINGDLECKKVNAQAQRRFCFYRRFYEALHKKNCIVNDLGWKTQECWADSVCIEHLDALCPVTV